MLLPIAFATGSVPNPDRTVVDMDVICDTDAVAKPFDDRPGFARGHRPPSPFPITAAPMITSTIAITW